jgi:hypothetical protein
MESWNSSNTDHRLSDNSETTTKEIVVNDYQTPNPSKLRREFELNSFEINYRFNIEYLLISR